MIAAPGILFGLAAGEAVWPWIVPTFLGFVGIYTLLPRPRGGLPILGGAAVGIALVWAAALLIRAGAFDAETFLFLAFSANAVIAAVGLVTLKNPVRGALSFALVILSTCGLFLLQGAPFLTAATTIVYAGAIIVTFVFVIMLAKQQGGSDADARAREPFLGSVTGFFLLAALLYVLPITGPSLADNDDPLSPVRWGVSEYSLIRGATVGRRPELPAENVAYLGRSLFSDYLPAVEMAGTLLLVATIGTILIAARRKEARR